MVQSIEHPTLDFLPPPHPTGQVCQIVETISRTLPCFLLFFISFSGSLRTLVPTLKTAAPLSITILTPSLLPTASTTFLSFPNFGLELASGNRLQSILYQIKSIYFMQEIKAELYCFLKICLHEHYSCWDWRVFFSRYLILQLIKKICQ